MEEMEKYRKKVRHAKPTRSQGRFLASVEMEARTELRKEIDPAIYVRSGRICCEERGAGT